MTERRVRFTATAQRHIRHEKQWWLENRIHTEIFTIEFEEALRILALLPGAGTPYPQAGVDGLRRLYLRKTASAVSMSTLAVIRKMRLASSSQSCSASGFE